MPSISTVHIRVDDEPKARAAEALAAVGLSTSEAVRLFVRRVVVEGGMPISLEVPDAETRAAMAEADAMTSPRFRGVEDMIPAIEQDAEGAQGQRLA